MDCLETVLLRKASGLRRDMAMLSSVLGGWHYQHQQSPLPSSTKEEEPCAATDRSGLLWEDFSVDDLLDLGGGKEQHGAGGEEFLQVEGAEGDEEEEEERGGCFNSSTSSCTSALSFQAAVPPSTSDPIVPVRSSFPSMAISSSGSPTREKPNPSVSGFETTQAGGDVEDLEWVSRFVDDSYSEFASAAIAPPFANLHTPAPPAPATAAKTEAPKARSTNSSRPLKRSWQSCCFSTESVFVPAKARSKRSRTGGRVWSLCRPSLLSEPSSSSCSSASSSSSCSGFSSVTSSHGGAGVNPDRFLHCLSGGPPLNQHQLPQLQVKKKKGRKPKVSAVAAAAGVGSGGAEQQARRRCSHCGVDKTPQWRAGPMGAKTLCNACGVRYKSGRLLPEYRPAGSPTFLSHVHSNSHRKVLEIRRSKELLAVAGPATCSPSPPQPVGATRPYGVV